jgi:Xaa-Pro aminopeptidase
MEEAGLDVLLMQTTNDTAGGYGRYFTDVPTFVQAYTVIFPRDSEMTVIHHGPRDVDEVPHPGDAEPCRGVERRISNAAFPSIGYTALYDARSAVSVLAPRRYRSIGIVGPGQMSYAFGTHVRRELGDPAFVDATDLVDQIKAVKSAEEQEAVRACARLQDAVMDEALAIVRPGIRERDVVAEARRAAHALGSEQGVYLIGSAPRGRVPTLNAPYQQGRTLDSGDILLLLLECNGPGGFYTELGRLCVLGQIPAELDEEFAFALEAQRFTISLLRPGASPGEIWVQYADFMRAHGREPERRIHAHGQGYDYVERPLIRDDETMPLEAGMNIACHPLSERRGAISWSCDNWLINAAGSERVHSFAQRVISL